MKKIVRECPREGEALSAVLGEGVSPDLARHATECAECREVVAVSTWLQGVARETVVGGLPPADRVWWRAQVERRLEERRALLERAARPIKWFERGAAAVIGLTVGGFLWSHGMPTAEVALTRFSDPVLLGGLTAALLTVAGLSARQAAQRP